MSADLTPTANYAELRAAALAAREAYVADTTEENRAAFQAAVIAEQDALNTMTEETSEPEIGAVYMRSDDGKRAGAWIWVRVTRVLRDGNLAAVAFDILGTDRTGRPSLSHSAMPVQRFAALYTIVERVTEIAAPAPAAEEQPQPGRPVIGYNIDVVRLAKRIGRPVEDVMAAVVDRGWRDAVAFINRSGVAVIAMKAANEIYAELHR